VLDHTRETTAAMPPSARPRPPVAVVQPLPGIGDMVWHLSHIRAIAEWIGSPVTILTKPRTLADQLFEGSPHVSDVDWIDVNPSGRRGTHDGVDGFVRLVRLLRHRRFQTIVILHHSRTLAMAAWAAGIPDRRGYGWGAQHYFLNRGPFLPSRIGRLHQLKRATAYLKAAGIPLSSDEPFLTIPTARRETARARLRLAGPFIAMGIGSSEPQRNWGVAKFSALAAELLAAGWPDIVLLGGPDDHQAAEAIAAASDPRHVHPALGWHLAEASAVVSEAAFCVANNTGMMNIAAAAGTRTYGVFGTTFPFDHASEIRRIMAPDIGIDDGAGRVSLDMVRAAILADRGRLAP